MKDLHIVSTKGINTIIPTKTKPEIEFFFPVPYDSVFKYFIGFEITN